MPEISVIIVNLNRKELLLKCLASLDSQRFPDREIIVVDNGSSDGSARAVRERYGDEIVIIENETNLGFAQGNNIGIRGARGRWIALINNDAEADPRWLSEMIKSAAAHPRAGMVACRILSASGRDRIDNVGVGLWRDGMSRGLLRGRRDTGLYEEQHRALIPSGCAAMYRRKMLDEIGLFDEDFFAYAEDTDLGLRGRMMGWECAFAPAAVVYHHYSSTAGPRSALKAFYAERNRIKILLRFYPALDIFFSPVFTFLRYVMLAWSFIRERNDSSALESNSLWEILIALVRAYAEAAADISAQIKKRRRQKKTRKVSDAEFREWLEKYRLDFKTLTSL